MWEEIRKELKRIELNADSVDGAGYEITEMLQETHLDADKRERIDLALSSLLETTSSVNALFRKVRPVIHRIVMEHMDSLFEAPFSEDDSEDEPSDFGYYYDKEIE